MRPALLTAILLLTLSGCDSEPVHQKGVGSSPSAERKDGGADPASDDQDRGSPGSTQAMPDPVVIDRCDDEAKAQLSAAEITMLRTGGSASGMRFLYPYAGTVFPRGLAAPVLMWEGARSEDAEAVYVHVKSSWFDFEGCLKPDAKGRIALPQDVWEKAGAQTLGKKDPFQIALSVLRDGVVQGPIEQEVVIAPGSLKGSLFYNSYSSPLARSQGASGGAVLRIPAGGKAEVFLGKRGCVGCHSVSAQGNRLVTGSEAENEGVYALKADGKSNPPPIIGPGTDFVGLYPDGSVYLTSGGVLVETDRGDRHPSTALPETLQMPMFAPDGRSVVYLNSLLAPESDAADGSLFIASYEHDQRKFGEPQVQVRDASMWQWPSFLPDSKTVVVANGENDLVLVNADGNVLPLARAMGFAKPEDAKASKTYLIGGDADLHAHFYPTVVPVAAGGYYWVFFDSSRRYGNFDTSQNNVAPGQMPTITGFEWLDDVLNPLVPPEGEGASRQLWAFAVEISPNGSYERDPSAPAFYLPGQEMGSNNHRAFAALDPCHGVGDACSSGTECCAGFCTDGQCASPSDACAKTEEACTTQDDCCDSEDLCINGFCSVIIY